MSYFTNSLHAVITFQTAVIVILTSVKSLILALKEENLSKEERAIGKWEWGMTNDERGLPGTGKATIVNMRNHLQMGNL